MPFCATYKINPLLTSDSKVTYLSKQASYLSKYQMLIGFYCRMDANAPFFKRIIPPCFIKTTSFAKIINQAIIL